MFICHDFGAEWTDDTGTPFVDFACAKCYEVYSGNTDPDITGGVDPTPEPIFISGDEDIAWSIMARGTADDTRAFTTTSADYPIVAFTIEELSTVDLENMPSQTEDER